MMTSLAGGRMMGSMAQGRRRVVVEAFDPLSLFPALWLDASDASTLYDATTGGSLVAADGAVARWEDKSGNARHATQGTSTNRPQRKVAIQNGKDVMRFDGAGDNVTLGRPLTSQSAVWFIVSKTSDTAYLTFFSTPTDSNFFDATQSGSTAAVSSTTGTVSIKANGNNVSPLNRSTLLTARGSNANLIEVSGVIAVGSTAKLMGYPGFDALIDIHEVLVYPNALSSPDRGAVESYLASKWGITLA